MHRTRRLIAIVAFVLFSSLLLEADSAPGPRINVYCLGATSQSGLIDPEIADSLKDLKEAIAKKKDWLQTTENRDDATIVLDVLGREYVDSGNVHIDANGYSANATKIYLYVLRVGMNAGDYTGEISGKVSSEYLFAGWRAAAGDVASQVEKFVKKNYVTLKSHKNVAPPPPAPAAPAAAIAPPAPVAPPPAAAVASSQSNPPQPVPEPVAAAPPKMEVLTNDSILAMAHAGLGDEVIIKKIKSSKTAFDVSAGKIVQLKKAGVSNRVIETMLESK